MTVTHPQVLLPILDSEDTFCFDDHAVGKDKVWRVHPVFSGLYVRYFERLVCTGNTGVD